METWVLLEKFEKLEKKVKELEAKLKVLEKNSKKFSPEQIRLFATHFSSFNPSATT